ncbi:uncharacterized protein LOC117171887 [Belonocnema kinseyi]|uniref:uncharacterized protein LOC117171887 n=1 Tax=Belonocnema kinseyi TaxID=2817044 RepID=UPI00143DD06E|nr:uncharacterized protein LOC117171887 [Belonocnema kinseyi]
MSQAKSKNVAQVGGTKSDETENPPVESVDQLEDEVTEDQPDENEDQPDENEEQLDENDYPPNGEEFESAGGDQDELNCDEEAVPIDSEELPNADDASDELVTNTEPEGDFEPNPESEDPPADAETNLESGDAPASESPDDKKETSVPNQKGVKKGAKGQNCDKYGWPIGSKYATEDGTSNETSLVEDAEADADGDNKANVKAEPGKVEEEILFKVTSSYVNKRSNMRKTVINVEDVEGAITEGIQAGTHLPHFVTYLGQKIKFRLTLSRTPDKKLKITIKFGGTGVEILKKIVCLWLCREDEDKDKILCQGLTRNKEELLIVLAQKFKEIEHIKEDPVALFEEIKQLVPELRGKEGLRSKDEAFLTAYKSLDEKLATLMTILYKEGCKRGEGENEETLALFRDMYFEFQIKPEFTLKQYLWAFYYYNLMFTPHICRDLEQMMQQYATIKNIELPSTPALIFPPGGQTSTVPNPYLKKKEPTPEDNALIEMGALSSDGFIPAEGDQFKKPLNPKRRTAQRRRQAYQRNRKGPDTPNNKGNSPNQRNLVNPRNASAPRNNAPRNNAPRNQPNQRNLSNQRNQQNPRNSNSERSEPMQRSPANKRRQGNQGGAANKKRPANDGDGSVQGDPPVAPVSVNQGNQPKKPVNRRRPPGQRNNQPAQRNNQPLPRNNQRNNMPSPRNNQSNSRNNNQVPSRNSRLRRKRPERHVREQLNQMKQMSRGPREPNFIMDVPRNLFSSSHINPDFLSMNLRNDDFMQHNDMRNQDFGRNQNFNDNQRSPSFSQSSSRNQSFSQGNQSRNNSFSGSNAPRSLFSQDFFDMPQNQNYSQNSSMGQSFSQQDSLRMPGRASDFFINSQDFFSGPSNYSNNRSSSLNRLRDEMQLSAFNNSRMGFANDNFNDNDQNRGKRKNYRDSWSSKRQKQGT